MPRGRTITKVIEVEECSAEQASAEFFRHNLVKGLSEETQKSYRGYVTNFIKWYGINNPVSEITTGKLDDYLYAQKTEKDNKDVSLATTMAHIRRFINFCVSRGYMEKIAVTVPKYEEELKEPYTDEEMKLLLARPITKNWVEWRCWAMTNYFFSTGQRLSTVLNIKVEHIDFEHSTVKLLWNKDKRPKYMPLSSALVKVLREYDNDLIKPARVELFFRTIVMLLMSFGKMNGLTDIDFLRLCTPVYVDSIFCGKSVSFYITELIQTYQIFPVYVQTNYTISRHFISTSFLPLS